MSIEFGFGISTKSDPVEAGRSVALGAIKKIHNEEPTLALLFASHVFDTAKVLKGVREILGHVPVYGMTTSGEIYNRNYDNSILLLLATSSHIIIEPFLISDLTADFDKALSLLLEEIRVTLSPGRSVTTPLMTLGFSGVPRGTPRHPLWRLVESCLEEGLIPPMFMACELGRTAPEGSGRVIVGDQVHSDAFLGLVFRTEVGFDILAGTGFNPTGKILTVTESRDGTVTALDGRHAWETYCRSLGMESVPLIRWREIMAERPLAIAGSTGFEPIIPFEVDSSGGFVFSAPLSKGMNLQIMEMPTVPDFLVSLVEKTIHRGRVKQPAFCLTFKAPATPRTAATEKFQDMEIRELTQKHPDVPVFGCYAETVLAPDALGGVSVREVGGAVLLLDRQLDPTVEALNRMEKLLVDYQSTNRELQARISELSNLYRITQNMTETIDLQRILRWILEGITNELGYDRVSLCLAKGRRIVGQMTIGHEHILDLFSVPLSSKENVLVSCLERKAPIVIEAPFPEGSLPEKLREGIQAPALACIPLIAHGKSLGVLVVDNCFSETPITVEGIQSLTTLGNTAASAMDNSLMHEKVKELNARLQRKVDLSLETVKKTNVELESSQDKLRHAYDNLQKANKELDEKITRLSVLNEISRSFISIHNLDQALHEVLQSAIQELGADRGSIMLIEPETAEMNIRVGIGLNPDAMLRYRFHVGEGIAGTAAKERQAILVTDASRDPRFIQMSDRRHPNSLICVPLIVKGEVLGTINIENKSTSRVFTDKDREFLEILASQGAVTIANAELFEKLQKNYFDTVLALSTAVEAKDPYTLGHSKRVTEYCIALADEFRLDHGQIQTLKFGAILHDVGKIGVSGNILNKPDRLTEAEYDSIKAHSVIGENIVKDIDFLQPVRPLIRHHQERYDGSGYPDGLRGDDIPFLACIIAVADVFDALITDRPYRPAFSHEDAIKLIEVDSGVQFHPRVVEAFLKIFR